MAKYMLIISRIYIKMILMANYNSHLGSRFLHVRLRKKMFGNEWGHSVK